MVIMVLIFIITFFFFFFIDRAELGFMVGKLVQTNLTNLTTQNY